MIAEFRDLFAYDRWANRRMIAASRELSPEQVNRDLGSSFPSVLATLRHMLAAEWIWAQRFHGHSPSGPPEGWEATTVAALEPLWTEVERQQQAFLAGASDADLERVMSYRNLQGADCAEPLHQILRQVINHSTYHRGQLATMLRQLGAAPPSTDLIVYYREMARPRSTESQS